MANHPYRSVQGVLYAPVATDLPAGLRSLISGLHGHVPPRLGRWAISVRLGVAVVCFAGGFLCARLFVDCLLGDPGACPCVLPPARSPVALALGLPALCAASFLTLAKTRLTAPRAVLGRAFLRLGHPHPAHSTGASHG